MLFNSTSIIWIKASRVREFPRELPPATLQLEFYAFHNLENNRTLQKLGLLKNEVPEGGGPSFEMAPEIQEMSGKMESYLYTSAKNSSSI